MYCTSVSDLAEQGYGTRLWNAWCVSTPVNIAHLTQSIDSKSCPAPLGGEERAKTRPIAKSGSNHILVDASPLAVHHRREQARKWSADDLIISITVSRPTQKQHLCADKGYDYSDVHQFVEAQNYIPHIKHRRRRGEPPQEEHPVPGETQYPARRWVVERTLGWLTKRRSLRVRWCKKPENWRAFVLFACANILCNMAIFG